MAKEHRILMSSDLIQSRKALPWWSLSTPYPPVARGCGCCGEILGKTLPPWNKVMRQKRTPE